MTTLEISLFFRQPGLLVMWRERDGYPTSAFGLGLEIRADAASAGEAAVTAPAATAAAATTAVGTRAAAAALAAAAACELHPTV